MTVRVAIIPPYPTTGCTLNHGSIFVFLPAMMKITYVRIVAVQ
jgi:hypothetical protein